MHDDIRHFLLIGEISDTNLVESKSRLVDAVEGKMRDEGYAPVLDMEPQWTLSYMPKSERYTFALTVYGTYVGRDESWSMAGVMGGKRIPRYSPLTK